MAAYISSRTQDTQLEQCVAKYLDTYLYSKLPLDFSRVTDKMEQVRGIDVKLENGTNIDEKVKVKGGYVSKILEYISFEISLKSQFDGKIIDGWFYKNGLLTDYYAFVTIFSTVDDWRKITFDNITKAVVLFVKKSDVQEWVGQYGHQFAIQRSADKLRRMAWLGDDVKRFEHRMFHLKLSTQYPEEPVNLVVKRERLKKLPHTKEVTVTKEGWSTAAKLGTCKNSDSML